MKKRLKSIVAAIAVSFLALGGVAASQTVSVTPVYAVDCSTAQPSTTAPTTVAGINPCFTTGDPGLAGKTQSDLANTIGAKAKLVLAMISGLVTIILVAVLLMKAAALSTASAHKRADAQQGLLWWAVGAFVAFSATVICTALYAFGSSAS